MIFEQEIIDWYKKHKRNLPWRNSNNAYFIWLSEIILQQTRVEQGMPYYIKFTENFPTVKHLAKADEKKVLKLWQGLGYYSRARNLHNTAKIISEKHKGIFPNTYDELIKLKGIGPYTAAAISSFAFNEVKAVVDGNVYRILARYFGIETPIDSTEGKKQFQELAQSIISKKKPAEHNQAIMEFGSQQCVPKNPDCHSCVLQNACYAFANKIVSRLPIKSKKTKTRNRYFNYLVLKSKNTIYIKQRTDKDIWNGLYDFPLLETTQPITIEKLMADKAFKKIVPYKSIQVNQVSKTYKHVLSHQIIYANFIEITIPKPPQNKNFIAVTPAQLKKHAVPRLIDLFLNDNKLV